MRSTIIFALSFISLLSSCKEKEKTTVQPTKETSKVTIDLTNMVGTQKLTLNSTVYTNQDGDDFQVMKFNYFISNIQLNFADGSTYATTGHYLISQLDTSSLYFDLKDVPNGTYRSVTFTIGVDSAANVKDVSSGFLKPADEMYLSSDPGYIMLNMEGMSPASNQPEHALKFHIGGYKEPNSVLRTITLNFPKDLVVNNDAQHIHISTDLMRMFGPLYIVDFSTLSAVFGPGDNAKVMANNYQEMFSVTGVGE